MTMLPLFFIATAALVSLRVHVAVYPPPLRILSSLWIAMFFVELFGHYLRDRQINHWIYNIFYLIYFPALANVFSHILSNVKVKLSIQFFYVTFIVFVLLNSIFIQGVNTLQTLTFVFGSCFISFLAGSYFWQLLASDDTESILRDSFFWLSFGLILYFGGITPFLGMFNYLVAHHVDFAQFYFVYVSNVFSILLNIIIIISYLCRVYPRLS